MHIVHSRVQIINSLARLYSNGETARGIELAMPRPRPPAPAPRISYAQWVRETIGRVRSSQGTLVPLFESSVPEPVELLRETVIDGFAEPITSRYTSTFVAGNPYVIDALAERYGVQRDRILSTTGATGALSLIYRALTRPGDQVLVESPGFDLFQHLALASGLDVGFFHRKGPSFSIDPDEIAARITPRSRLIVLTDLHNPSGFQIPPDTLDAIARIAEQHDILVVADEVYGDYADRSARPLQAAQRSPRFISISSLAKIYGLAALRCGWLIAAPEPLVRLRAVSETTDFGISSLAHAVAAMVLEKPERFDNHSAEIIRRCRPIIESYWQHWRDQGLTEGDLPAFGCISFPKLLGIDESERFAAWLAGRSGVIVAPGDYFGAPGHIRIGHAQIAGNLDYGLDALTQGLKSYRDMLRTS